MDQLYLVTRYTTSQVCRGGDDTLPLKNVKVATKTSICITQLLNELLKSDFCVAFLYEKENPMPLNHYQQEVAGLADIAKCQMLLY